ncbi:MAG TPA: GTP 3',8-cyclase MoaA [Candidatus Flavonifractor merdigallinarum]|uniref:GTP 3',8-cyclase n=1 Tax=Candidatus Flavonifractor merdigallinarum TaxID=2838589 RepID=A0A9D2BYV0_9FIRM|nr:GTP 3',8-cyclase MoaA [Candidatus Flavonifractor merdigallinarum]
MIDGQGRTIDYLRISVTDRCNLCCVYCMPPEGVEWMPHADLLSYEEIIRLCHLFARLGVRKVRLTGGEPLARKGLPQLVAGIRAIPGIESVSMTTNGIALAEQLPALLDAGLSAVNLSLDTLDRAQYAAITRRDKLEDALRGLHAALDAPGLRVKLNCVPMGENDGQLVPLAALAQDHDLAVRFIELMPIGLGGGLPGRTEEEVRARLEAAFGPMIPCSETLGAGPGHYFTLPHFLGKVGFISAMTHQFCHQCNRVRLTATGFLKTCLQYETGVDLRALLRGGADDGVLEAAIAAAIQHKPLRHHFGDAAVQRADERHNMHQIGG